MSLAPLPKLDEDGSTNVANVSKLNSSRHSMSLLVSRTKNNTNIFQDSFENNPTPNQSFMPPSESFHQKSFNLTGNVPEKNNYINPMDVSDLTSFEAPDYTAPVFDDLTTKYDAPPQLNTTATRTKAFDDISKFDISSFQNKSLFDDLEDEVPLNDGDNGAKPSGEVSNFDISSFHNCSLFNFDDTPTNSKCANGDGNEDELRLTNLDPNTLDKLSLIDNDEGQEKRGINKVHNPWDVSHVQRHHSHTPYPEGIIQHINEDLQAKKIRKGFVINTGRYNFKIVQKIAEGGFATIFKAENEKKPLVVKVEETSFPWETLVLGEIKRRFNETESLRKFTNMLPEIFLCIRYNGATCMLMEEMTRGTLLQYQHERMQYKKDIGKVELAIRMMELVHALHTIGILHGDIKPDNFMVVGETRDKQHNPVPKLKLIDFGRAIDLKSHPDNVVFMQPSKTDSFECTQMTKKQPWNYHIDFYGLAGTMHVMMYAKYMETVDNQGSICIAQRRIQPMWTTFFDALLNFKTPTESCVPTLSDSPLPRLIQYLENI